MDAEKCLSKLSIEEKVLMLSGKNTWQSAELQKAGIESMFLSDGPCGLRKQTGPGDHLGIEDSLPATACVSGGLLAATWNIASARENGRILGEEAADEEVDILLAPALNIVRSPLCGRNFEYFSEDPFLTGSIAASYTEGVQESGVGACPKHFAGNNQETEREYINALIDERTLREIYLPGFEQTVKQAHPQAVMSALNQINGEYGAESAHLLTEILRDEWGFEGFTVSDWFGIVHREKAVKAGLDLEMPGSNGAGTEVILKALNQGILSEEDIDRCCLRMIRASMECSKRKHNRAPVNRKELRRKNHERCRKIAREGIVLLKNESNILPLKAEDNIAVIGLFAEKPMITLEGSARVVFSACDIPLQEMREISGRPVRYAPGYKDFPAEEDLALADEAVSLAAVSEKVVFFMGQIPGTEMEGHDRKHLDLPKYQEALLSRILDVNPNVIVVLSNASAVAMPWHSRVKGIFECFLAGQGFGRAIAELLYGVVSPSGKLPVSFTKRLEDTSAYFFFPGDKKTVAYNEGVFVGYRYYDKKNTELLYPFGFGLSYTDFCYLDGTVTSNGLSGKDQEFEVSVSVRNTGEYDGAEVVQLYVGMFDCEVRRPVKELKGFHKVFLRQGEEKRITFKLGWRDFAWFDSDHHEWRVSEGTYRLLIGSSSRDIRIEQDVRVLAVNDHLKKLSGWSTMGEMRKTPLGEQYYSKIEDLLKQYAPDGLAFFSRSELSERSTLDNIHLRLASLLTNGKLNNDMLLQMIDKINQER